MDVLSCAGVPEAVTCQLSRSTAAAATADDDITFDQLPDEMPASVMRMVRPSGRQVVCGALLVSQILRWFPGDAKQRGTEPDMWLGLCRSVLPLVCQRWAAIRRKDLSMATHLALSLSFHSWETPSYAVESWLRPRLPFVQHIYIHVTTAGVIHQL